MEFLRAFGRSGPEVVRALGLESESPAPTPGAAAKRETKQRHECSPHIARKVEGSNRRENPDTEICEGLRQQVGDVGHTSAMMHLPSGTQARPFDLTPQILKRRSWRSEGGQIVQELNSIREGKYWDDANGGWLDPILVRKAREEEMQCVKKYAVYEKVPMGQ